MMLLCLRGIQDDLGLIYICPGRGVVSGWVII